jgi:dihydrofolate synthase/folylpolyglutamate synthase
MEYQEAVSWLLYQNNLKNWEFSEAKSYRFDLEMMNQACLLFGNPEKNLSCIHVGGTNGKGSTCTKIAKALELAGFKVGLYTSPHITSFCERIQINGIQISEKEFAKFVSLIREKTDSTGCLGITLFEAITLAAFLWYQEKCVDYAVIEVGLGGRLDATNVCIPIVSVITSISFDHTHILGNTLEKITTEKAGIIKRKIPVVIGPRVPINVIKKKAQEMEAPLKVVEGMFDDFDKENNAIARSALSVLEDGGVRFLQNEVELALQYRPACRFERIPQELVLKKLGFADLEVVLDVAHNPDGIEHMLKKFNKVFRSDKGREKNSDQTGYSCSFPKAIFLCSISQDKDIDSMISALLHYAEVIVFTQSSGGREASSEKLKKITSAIDPECTVYVEENIEKAVVLAMTKARLKNVPLIVTGTFYVMTRVRNMFYDTINVPCRINDKRGERE